MRTSFSIHPNFFNKSWSAKRRVPFKMNKTFSRFTFPLNRCVSTYTYIHIYIYVTNQGKWIINSKQYEVDKYLTNDKCIRVIYYSKRLESCHFPSFITYLKSLVTRFNRCNIFFPSHLSNDQQVTSNLISSKLLKFFSLIFKSNVYEIINYNYHISTSSKLSSIHLYL